MTKFEHVYLWVFLLLLSRSLPGYSQHVSEELTVRDVIHDMRPEEVLRLYDRLGKVDSTCLEEIPGICPLHEEEVPYLTSGYGLRLHPLEGKFKQHQGLDLACRRGFQLVYATANGRVIWSGHQKGLGLSLTLLHPSGYETTYGHLSALYIRENDWVRRGEIIGTMGRTGKATGIHLHYAIRKAGQFVDPLPYLRLYEEYIKNKDAGQASSSRE
ncbi:M23 family metallopeptidase [Telluribacter humicola]|uniref:M23 family metallopeptidase n=1 Tax=Telluribacter humicola TaxID=1720261 RepID=UPI001A97A077|nr:M23 family metallopeptidase [Telluribacter humicola]